MMTLLSNSRRDPVFFLALYMSVLNCFYAVAAEEVPEEFPEVALSAGSKPRYTALALDEEIDQVAYVLFDGNVTDGYRKIYVWIPGDPKYKNPVAIRTTAEGNNFPPFERTQSVKDKDKDKASISWRLAWRTRRSGGKRTRVDYATGKTTTTTSKVVTYAVFPFTVDYAYGRHTGLARGSSKAPLDISIHGELRVSDTWEELPKALAPWKKVYFNMTRTAQYEKEKGRLLFKGRLLHSHHRPCTVRSLPEDTEIILSINPYLEAPVYSNMLSVAEAFADGVGVELPYGWYRYRWSFKCNGLKVSPSYYRQHYWPIPFSNPAGK